MYHHFYFDRDGGGLGGGATGRAREPLGGGKLFVPLGGGGDTFALPSKRGGVGNPLEGGIAPRGRPPRGARGGALTFATAGGVLTFDTAPCSTLFFISAIAVVNAAFQLFLVLSSSEHMLSNINGPRRISKKYLLPVNSLLLPLPNQPPPFDVVALPSSV